MLHKARKMIILCGAAVLIIIATVTGTMAFESLSEWNWEQPVEQKLIVRLETISKEDGDTDGTLRVKNEGTTDAYVRVIAAVPTALDGEIGTEQSDTFWNYTETAEINGVPCNLYAFIYEEILNAGETTKEIALDGFYEGNDTMIGQVNIYTTVQAVQAYGFEHADLAFRTAGLPENPWDIASEQP